MKILISTGGTGGHIFPAIETAKALRNRGHHVSFAGTLGANEVMIKELGFPVYALAARGLDDNGLRDRLGWLVTMSQAVFRSFGVIRKCAPDKIIGFGGYASFPVAMAGSLMRRPVLIHEQNVVPGRANALLTGMVAKVAISFEASRKFINPSKAVWTGCPCRYKSLPSKEQGLAAFGLEAGKKTLVLIGGSQGSQRLNEVFF
jgi:UDP-N-acetylglucosamine--N-acetylmuramyl-(pentapeptide) pyrophosphoryl-undecaprenol N-acetylglucosamine transferase